MKLVRGAFLLALTLQFVALGTPQNTPPLELGTIQGTITRAGNKEPIAGASVTLQGGAADPQAMQTLLNIAASQGLVVNPAPGASTAETLQALSNVAVARGFPLTLANLQSQLASLSGKTPPTTNTDRDGRFSFKDLSPGSYTVRAQMNNYFGDPEGGIYQPTAAIDVTVAAKETKEANLSMIPAAVVAGRVFDTTGQVMSNATVQAFTVAYAFGHAVLAPLVSKTTDDRGEYRLFPIPPGDYYIATTPRPAAVGPGVPAATSAVKTFYPGVSTAAEARLVTLRGGEEMNGMDIGLRNTATFKVSGQITSLIPPPAPQLGAASVNAAVLMLLNRDESFPDDVNARQVGTIPLLPTTGKFEISGIAPGNYDLFARVQDPAAAVAGGQPLAWGRVRVDVRDSDVSGLAITVPPSIEIKGAVVTSGGGAVPGSLRVQLLPADASIKIAAYQLIATRSAVVTADGSFSVPAVPDGRYSVATLAGLPAGSYLADVRQNAMSVFDSGFEVNARNSGPIEVVIGSGAGTVSGIVQNGPATVFAGATVALVPEAKRRQNRALYMAAASGADGRFTIRGVPPGDYKVFAWESIPAFAYQNSAFIAKYEERGKLVHVGQGGTASAELTLIPVVEKQ